MNSSSVWSNTALAIALSHDTTYTGMEGRELYTIIDYERKYLNCSNVHSITTRWGKYTLLSVFYLVILFCLLKKRPITRLRMSSYGPPYDVIT